METNKKVTQEVFEAAKKFEAMLAKRPVEEKLAVSLISKNILNGCSWEFCRPNPELRQHMDDFKKNPNCSLQEVTYNHEQGIYGYLVRMDMDCICTLFSSQYNGPLTQQDLVMAKNHRQEAITSLVNKLKSGYTGKIGIFCTNDSQSITVQGKTYPAYAITLGELCQVCSQMGYGIMVSGQVRDPGEVMRREDAVLKSLTVAPSSNALFIQIGRMGR